MNDLHPSLHKTRFLLLLCSKKLCSFHNRRGLPSLWILNMQLTTRSSWEGPGTTRAEPKSLCWTVMFQWVWLWHYDGRMLLSMKCGASLQHRMVWEHEMQMYPKWPIIIQVGSLKKLWSKSPLDKCVPNGSKMRESRPMKNSWTK